VLDMHVHFHASTRTRAPEVIAAAGLTAAISVWDTESPPRPYDEDLAGWRALEPRLLRCHAPDLSGVGAPGFGDDLIAGVRAARASGCVGIKVWKHLGLWLRDDSGRRVAVDDARLEDLWEVAGEQRLPVLIHVGDPPEFWQPVTPANPRYGDLKDRPQWWYGSGDFPALESILAELERVVAGHPGTTFVAAHFGCFASDLERWFASYSNFHVDTAAAVAEIGKGDVSRTRRLFLDWPDRILFGTDLVRTARFRYPDLGERSWELGEFFARHWRFFETGEGELEHPIPEQLPWKVTGLDLPHDVLRALYHDNAARLYDLPDGLEADS
jgi:predicted TIM-barrel fold metal-dependent hydrolase